VDATPDGLVDCLVAPDRAYIAHAVIVVDKAAITSKIDESSISVTLCVSVIDMKNNHVHEWMTPAEASAALGVSARTVARLADRGEIRSVRASSHRRYLAADVAAILARKPWDAA